MNNLMNCLNCGQPRDPGDRFCKNCGKPFEEPRSETPPPGMPPTPPPGATQLSEGKYVAWEDKTKQGFFNALWKTWSESVFYPDRFFSMLPPNGGLFNPLIFAVIVGWLGIFFNQMYNLIFSGIAHTFLYRFVDSDFLFARGMQATFEIVYMIFAPFIIVISIFIASGIYHLLFMIFGWAKRDFEATFRAIAYSFGPYAFMILPICGGIVGAIWNIVLVIIGFKHMQQTSGGKAAFIFFLPLILCCCIMTALGVIFGAALLALIREFMHSANFPGNYW